MLQIYFLHFPYLHLGMAVKLNYLWLDQNRTITIIIIFLRGLGCLTCSGNDALLSFPGASMVSSSSRFVVEGVFRESGVVHSFKVVDIVLFVFESHVLYSRELWFFPYDFDFFYPVLCIP